MKKKYLISTRNLSIGYRRPLLEDLNLPVDEATFTAVIGANGSGKSTLLMTLAGLHKPLKGDIYWRDKKISAAGSDTLSRMRSLVMSDEMPFGPFTVFDWVASGRLPYTNWMGKLRDDDVQIVSKSLARMNLEKFAARRIRELSQGELQKVRLAKALAQDTPAILLDEPETHLDFPSKAEIFYLLKDLCDKEGKTILAVTHQLDYALQLADVIWLIDNDGNLIRGSAEQLIESGAVNRLFRGDNTGYDVSRKAIVFKK